MGVGLRLYIQQILKEIAMLSIEYVNKRVRLFRLELSPLVLAILALLLLVWHFLSFLRIIK